MMNSLICTLLFTTTLICADHVVQITEHEPVPNDGEIVPPPPPAPVHSATGTGRRLRGRERGNGRWRITSMSWSQMNGGKPQTSFSQTSGSGARRDLWELLNRHFGTDHDFSSEEDSSSQWRPQPWWATTTRTPPTATTPWVQQPIRRSGQCGIVKAAKTRSFQRAPVLRISNGEYSRPHSWPWQAALGEVRQSWNWNPWSQRSNTRSGQSTRGSFAGCGAAVVSANVVATAAHCLHDFTGSALRASNFCVFVGIHNIDSAERDGTKCHRVSRYVVHPQFDYDTVENDIALLFLQNPLTLNDRIQPVCLPAKDASVGKSCYVTGWGETERGRLSDTLREAEVHVLSQSKCRRAHGWGNFDSNSMLCAMGARGVRGRSIQDSCTGDSGGPMVCETSPNSGIWELQGIVSWGGDRCSDKSSPGVYTRVANMMSWVRRYV